MRRPVFVLALLPVLLAPALVLPRTVDACTGSPGGPAEIVASGDIAFAGEVVGLRVADEHWSGINHFVPVWVDFRVDHYLKGNGPTAFAGFDPVSVAFMDLADANANDFDQAEFIGAGGACGSLWDDPRGEYWVAAATLINGNYQLAQPMIIARGSGPNDPAILEALQAVGVTPAATGHGLAHTADRGVPLAVVLAALAILGGSRLATRERRGATGAA